MPLLVLVQHGQLAQFSSLMTGRHASWQCSPARVQFRVHTAPRRAGGRPAQRSARGLAAWSVPKLKQSGDVPLPAPVVFYRGDVVARTRAAGGHVNEQQWMRCKIC
jgi:hypothetical protein